MNLEQQILTVLDGMKEGQRPATFGDLARRFGATGDLVARCGREMVDKGLAQPSMVDIRGVSTLRGLLPRADRAAS